MQVRNSITGNITSKVSRAVTVALLALALAAGGGIANVAEAQAATAAQVRHAKAVKVRRAKAKRAAKVRARRAALRKRAARRARHAAALKKKRANAAKRRRAAALKAKRKARVGRRYGAGWHRAEVSWYGPGFYGQGMAGGGKLKKTSMIVAHKSLPFGTKVEFKYKGRTVVATVRDRGPYVRGREFDLGPGIARALHMYSVANVSYRIVRR